MTSLKKNSQEVIAEIDYIMQPDKVPLDTGRWGYPQYNIQTLFQDMSVSCQVSKINTSLKMNRPCLLRHGVYLTTKQSFIACIADAIYYGAKSKQIPSIQIMKNQIINAIDIDNYITLQNGNNYIAFANEDIARNIDTSYINNKYSYSKLYKKIFGTKGSKEKNDKNILYGNEKEKEIEYFKRVISSYESFITYMKDDSAYIDYTYLWDLICRPNPRLAKTGLNLVIFEIANNDITNNINFICPTNHYSNEIYRPERDTLFLIKSDNYFEPLYMYENKVKNPRIIKLFKETDKKLSKVMVNMFNNIVKPLMANSCKPLPSLPQKYNKIHQFKHPILLYDLIEQLIINKYNIEKQILNYQGKVVGIYARRGDASGYIPCYPSALEDKYDYVFMNETTLYNTYNETLIFLNTLSMDNKIPCNPDYIVVEDDHVVGFLTETNQFIMISEPYPVKDVKEDIPRLSNSNYIFKQNETTDMHTINNISYDTERTMYIKKLKLETNFYNVFRNTIRLLINDYKNIKLREKIEGVIGTSYLLHSMKQNRIIDLLRELSEGYIMFSDNYDPLLLEDISSCIMNTSEKCLSKNPVCSVNKINDTCMLVIPLNNLFDSTTENNVVYFAKMADELIRYTRIKSFIFTPQTYLSFGKIGYNLRNDEIILVQSLLNKQYFSGLVPKITNSFAKYNTYDNTNPMETQTYDNDVIVENGIIKDTSSDNIGTKIKLAKKAKKVSTKLILEE